MRAPHKFEVLRAATCRELSFHTPDDESLHHPTRGRKVSTEVRDRKLRAVGTPVEPRDKFTWKMIDPSSATVCPFLAADCLARTSGGVNFPLFQGDLFFFAADIFLLASREGDARSVKSILPIFARDIFARASGDAGIPLFHAGLPFLALAADILARLSAEGEGPGSVGNLPSPPSVKLQKMFSSPYSRVKVSKCEMSWISYAKASASDSVSQTISTLKPCLSTTRRHLSERRVHQARFSLPFPTLKTIPSFVECV